MPGSKAVKDRLTLLFGGNAAGDMKLKSLLLHLLENSKRAVPIVWKSNAKTLDLYTGHFFRTGFSQDFIPFSGILSPWGTETLLGEDIPFNILLLLSHALSHPIHG